MKNDFSWGFRLGIPIALGYYPASFSFGILAVSYGLTWWQALMISMLTLTSAGQFSGISTMRIPGDYMGMVVSQLTINARYSVMGISLSQKMSRRFTGLKRVLLSFFLTDEIFAMANLEKEVTPELFGGLAVAPYLGWTLGTLSGSLMGAVLPDLLLNSFGMALYGLFIAAVVPKAKKEKPIGIAVLMAAAIGTALYYIPTDMTAGIRACLAAVMAAMIASCLFTMGEEETS